MAHIIQTDSSNYDFINLVKALDADLAARDGSDHGFYAQFNKIENIRHVVVAYEDEKPVACGAMKEFTPLAMEIKRMYTLPEYRGKGLATMVLTELEIWAAELRYQTCLLETGKRQPEAISLYEKNGYTQVPNYGQYAGVENSVCFQKYLSNS